MLLKYFYDTSLAHASYLVGCQKTGEAIVIDPGRDTQQYLDLAAANKMKIVGAADTHIHADYVSGARQLADQNRAKLFVSDEGPAEWKYEYASDYDHQLLKDGDTFNVGKIEFKVLHTPGHTPESISFLLTDKGGGASEPMGIFTGDFVFVGSIGRPDLLEEAAGVAGTAEPGARDLYRSIEKFNQLPDYLQVWPAHGAGSACGKGLGAIPSSTVGYEKRFNPALQYESEDNFVDYILSEQPEAPTYFALMKRVNKEGPHVLAMDNLPDHVAAEKLPEVAADRMVIDTRSPSEFATAHVEGTINIPMKYLAAWAGWLVDYDHPLFLLTNPEDLVEANRVLMKIGVERFGGYFDLDEVASVGLMTGSYTESTPQDLVGDVEAGNVVLIDVRGETEWTEHHIAQAQRCFLARLPEKLKEFSGPCTIVFQCRSGGRSAIAASLAKAAGVGNVVNMLGGIQAWEAAGFATAINESGCCGPKDDASTVDAACQSQAVFWNARCPELVEN